MKDVTRAYRESEVRGATPVGLIVILYEEVVRSIRRAQRSLQQNNIEQKTLALTHALEVIGHLHATLDFEHGGDVAKNLSRFYTFSRAKILEANVQSNYQTLEMLANEFASFAQTWRQVDRAVSGMGTAASQAHEELARSKADQFQFRGALAET